MYSYLTEQEQHSEVISSRSMALELLAEAKSLVFCCEDGKVIDEFTKELKNYVEKLRKNCPVLSERISKEKKKTGRKKKNRGKTIYEKVIIEEPRAQDFNEIDKGL